MKTRAPLLILILIMVVVFVGMAVLPPQSSPTLPEKIATPVENFRHTRVEIATPTDEFATLAVCRLVSGYPDGTVNLRENAGMQYAVLTVLHEGDILDYLDKDQDGWKYVQLNVYTGWVNSSYVQCSN